jgi:nucleoside-diphosphate-sugar epimerase
MATIHLIGSEGFIGRAVQHQARDHDLHCWSHSVADPSHHFDLLDPSSWQALLSQQPRHVLLLSWPGLPDYDGVFHLTRNLPASIELIERLFKAGLRRLVLAGTCYEYGLQHGPLREDQPADPVNAYAIAKDALRRLLARRCPQEGVQWCWARVFYAHGTGQNPNSLLPSLQAAIERGDAAFAMGSGRQVRDFVAVDDVARQLLLLLSHPDAHGIYNCGSGKPVSIRELAERTIAESAASISLQLGARPDRVDEPLAFWADINKLLSLS